jgi:hypothetical protein
MRLILIITAFLLTRTAIAQDLIIAHEDDSVKIEYSILEVKKKGEVTAEIRFVITNKTKEYINLDFVSALFYELTMAEATQVKNLCLEPEKIKKGKIKGLFYQPETLTYEQMISTDFEISIDDIKLVKIEKCK